MVGRYRIDAKLAEGGVADVYRATDTSCGRTVALKLLPANSLSDPERRRRFLKEVQAVSALKHRNIVSLIEVGIGDPPFLAMEYVDGRTLQELLSRGRLRHRDAVSYAIQIADGVAAAHALGIIHRDLKPANIMFDGRKLVKILDFGLAKVMRARLAAAASETLNATQPGTVLGTASYMAPEQAQGKPVSPASDVFSIGAVLYEMLCGRKAFEGESYVAVLGAIVNDAPPPLKVAPPLTAIVERCLAKKPESRYPSAAELHSALTACKPRPWMIRGLLDRLL